jgi:phosphoglycerol transferase MdoB-like AlkP superfamily enzyme
MDKEIIQILALVFTDTSILLTAGKKPKYAVIVGLLAQPFWFASLYYGFLPILFVNQILLTLFWVKGIYNYWIKKPKEP